MAASTAIMHSTASALGTTATAGGGPSSSSSSTSVANTVVSSAMSSSSASSNASHSPENDRVCSSSDEEEVVTPLVELRVDTAEIKKDGNQEEDQAQTDDEDESASDEQQIKRSAEPLEPETEECSSPKPATTESTNLDDADDSSTIVGEDDEENSQQSIEVDDEPVGAKDSTNIREQSGRSTESAISPTAQSASLGLFAPSSNTTTNTTGPKKLSTGKLERITAALARKQSDGHVPSNLLESLASLRDSLSPASSVSHGIMAGATSSYDDSTHGPNSVAPPESSATTISEDEELMDEEDVDEDDEGMLIDEDEEDEEIKNGFRALGLMGNVAFMGEEKFKCPVCGLKLDSQHTFTLHIRSHNPNDHSNTCRLCGKTLSSASSLDRHMLIHSGERPFKCSICNMAFTTNGNMHRHMRTHGHGTIGYTPRGAKRRAKLFAQQAAKVATAAAAGEPVDAATISKLKKSALEVTTGNGKSPISGTPMKKQRGSGRRTSDHFASGEMMMAGLNGASGPNSAATRAEAEQIAAAAAAYAASVAASSDPSPKGSLKKGSHANTQNNNNSATSPFAAAFQQHHAASHLPPNGLHHASPSSMPLNLAGWPADLGMHHLASAPPAVAPVIPTKGKPGRKKKIRLPEDGGQATAASVPAGGQQQQHQTAFPAGAFSNLTAPTLCPICACRVGSKMELHVHMASFHAAEKLFCLDCGMILENYNVYTQHHCTVTAAAVMTALSANPQANPELLFRSTNTSRMNFSSARFPGMLPPNPHAGPLPNGGAPSPQDHLSSLMSQLSKTLSGQSNGAFPGGKGDSSSFFNAALAQQQSRANHASQPIVDLSAKSQKQQHSSAFGGGQSCGHCDRRFANTKLLKQHFDTFCHECSTDCGSPSGLMTHQFQHSIEKFPNLTKALGSAGKASEGFNNAMAAALPGLLGMQTGAGSNALVGNMTSMPRNNSASSSSPYYKRHSYPKPSSSPATSSASLDLTTTGAGHSSIASLTSTMADMKPDLADIQSILSMAKHAKLPLSTSGSGSNSVYKPVPSLSPNRASDAGVDSKKTTRHGDATSHPDSPASADSAAAAVASATNGHSSQLATTSLTADQAAGDVAGHETAKTNGGESQQQHHEEYLDDEEEDQELMPTPSKRRRRSASGSPNKGSSNSKSESERSPGSGAQRFRCEQCRLSFKSMNAFRRHNRGHTAGGGHSHACHLCPYKSLDKSTLIRHLRTHNGERPFQCAICKYAFTTKANCERHVRKRHRNLKSKSEIRSAMQYNRDMAATAAATKMVSEKIFIERDELPTSQDTVCKQCSVDFTTNRELRAHLRVPNNPCSQQLKPFVCTICKIGFNTRNNCVRHIIKQHPATIECADEDATAKLISAVNATGAGETAESLIIETGSSASLSPGGSGGQMSGHSGFSDRSFSGSEHGMSECESYGTYDEEAKSSPMVSPNSNASFAALCQVAAVEKRLSNGQQQRAGSKSPEEVLKPKTTTSATAAVEPSKALNLSCKTEMSGDEDVLDLSRPKRSAGDAKPLNGGLDLSVKTSSTNKMPNGHSVKMEPRCEIRSLVEPDPMLLMRSGSTAAASSLMSLYKSEAEQQQQHQAAAAAAMALAGQNAAAAQHHFDMNAMAAATFAKYGHPAITNETLANLMAQFHQHQAAQFAAMKAPTINAKNH